MSSTKGSHDLPRYWITLGKDIIWDYPKDFLKSESVDTGLGWSMELKYPYINDISEISCLIRDYIDTPKSELLERKFDDRWGLTAILHCADRRIGLKRLNEKYSESDSVVIQRLLAERNAHTKQSR